MEKEEVVIFSFKGKSFVKTVKFLFGFEKLGFKKRGGRSGLVIVITEGFVKLLYRAGFF